MLQSCFTSIESIKLVASILEGGGGGPSTCMAEDSGCS